MEGETQPDVTLNLLYSKSANMVVANQALIDEINAILKQFYEREKELASKEALLKMKTRDGSEHPRDGGDGKEDPKHLDNLAENLERLEKLKHGLAREKDLLHRGRVALNADIKRHHAQMKAIMMDLKKRAEEERLEFFDTVVREIELFKLPSAAKTFESGKVNSLLAEIKEIEGECLKHEEK